MWNHCLSLHHQWTNHLTRINHPQAPAPHNTTIVSANHQVADAERMAESEAKTVATITNKPHDAAQVIKVLTCVRCTMNTYSSQEWTSKTWRLCTSQYLIHDPNVDTEAWSGYVCMFNIDLSYSQPHFLTEISHDWLQIETFACVHLHPYTYRRKSVISLAQTDALYLHHHALAHSYLDFNLCGGDGLCIFFANSQVPGGLWRGWYVVIPSLNPSPLPVLVNGSSLPPVRWPPPSAEARSSHTVQTVDAVRYDWWKAMLSMDKEWDQVSMGHKYEVLTQVENWSYILLCK